MLTIFVSHLGQLTLQKNCLFILLIIITIIVLIHKPINNHHSHREQY